MKRTIMWVAAVVAVAFAAFPSAAAQDATAAISVTGWQADRLGTSVWRGDRTGLERERFLRGARLATLAPTGETLAYVRYAGTGFDLLVAPASGGATRKLAHIAGSRTTALAFTPDGRTIAFATPRGIELVSTRGGRSRAVSLPARWRGSEYRALAFSPNGRLLAFSRTWGDGKAGTLRNELALTGLDGGARSLARNPDPYSAQLEPVFAPDGQQVAFGAADGSLASVSVDGGRLLRLTTPRAPGSLRTDSDPLFSCDGAWIAFTRAPGRGGTDVYVVRPDGRGLRRLTRTPLPPPGEPRTGSRPLAWSPNGTELLAFRHDRFALVDFVTGADRVLARVGVQYELGSAVWR